jgi:hypothetical protein
MDDKSERSKAYSYQEVACHLVVPGSERRETSSSPITRRKGVCSILKVKYLLKVASCGKKLFWRSSIKQLTGRSLLLQCVEMPRLHTFTSIGHNLLSL